MALRLFYVTNLVKNSNLNNQSHLSIKKGVLNMAQTLAQTKQISQSHTFDVSKVIIKHQMIQTHILLYIQHKI